MLILENFQYLFKKTLSPMSVVDTGFNPPLVKPKTISLIFIASPLIMQH